MRICGEDPPTQHVGRGDPFARTHGEAKLDGPGSRPELPFHDHLQRPFRQRKSPLSPLRRRTEHALVRRFTVQPTRQPTQQRLRGVVGHREPAYLIGKESATSSNQIAREIARESPELIAAGEKSDDQKTDCSGLTLV